ncbi:MAG: conserved membrane protein of unknown function [Promethearchaeota archaeon]|nr:MAG: conserved membrane protein of unknown function [Candidatus Lokiarchaeota archaeon]
MINEVEQIFEEYLDKVKEKLPEWLKEDKEELNSILEELEDHLRNKAEELSDVDGPTPQSARLAVAHLGSPSSIAKEYKRRGTPHVYISKELWPIYKKVLMIVFPILAAVITFSILFNVFTGNFEDAANIIQYWTAFSSAFLIISLIFVGLSMEGYFPEDFRSKAEQEQKEKEKKKGEALGLPVSPKTGEQLKPFVKPIEKYIGGAISMVIAMILITQAIPGFFSVMEYEFRVILFLFGILILIDAITTLIRGFLGNRRVLIHQIIHGITIILKIVAVPLFITLFLNPELFPVVYWEGSKFIASDLPEILIESIGFSMLILTIVMIATIASNIYEIIKLEKYKG